MPAQRDAAQLYERYLAPIMAPFVAAVVDAAAPAGDADVLDVACGTGFAARVTATSRPDARVTGVDVNEAMLAEAAERATAEGLTITWRRAPAEQLPFPDASFDAVTCQQALQFFRDPAAALVEMARVTRPGGRVAATVWAPMDHSPYMQAQYLALKSVVGDERVASLREAFAFSCDRLVEVFAGAGLSEVTVREVVADVTLPDFDQFVIGHLQALPRDAAAAPARARGAEEVGPLIVQRLSDLVQPDGSATVAFASYLASGVR